MMMVNLEVLSFTFFLFTSFQFLCLHVFVCVCSIIDMSNDNKKNKALSDTTTTIATGDVWILFSRTSIIRTNLICMNIDLIGIICCIFHFSFVRFICHSVCYFGSGRIVSCLIVMYLVFFDDNKNIYLFIFFFTSHVS